MVAEGSVACTATLEVRMSLWSNQPRGLLVDNRCQFRGPRFAKLVALDAALSVMFCLMGAL